MSRLGHIASLVDVLVALVAILAGFPYGPI
jgi:hypothetical protein